MIVDVIDYRRVIPDEKSMISFESKALTFESLINGIVVLSVWESQRESLKRFYFQLVNLRNQRDPIH